MRFSEYSELASVVIVLVPAGIIFLTYSFVRRKMPEFRIQYSISELWILALCFSPAMLITVKFLTILDPFEAIGVALAIMLNQAAGAFFLYSLERLTPEKTRAAPMALTLIAGSLIGLTIVSLISYIVVNSIVWIAMRLV